MKNCPLILLLLFNIIHANGQGFAIEKIYDNYFYAGLNNHLLIAAEGCSNNDLVFKVSHGKLFQENGEYYFYTDSLEQCEITAFKKNKDELIEIGTHIYIVRRLPTPILHIGNHGHKDSIPLNELNIYEHVYARPYSFAPTDPRYAIDSCKIIISCGDLSTPKIFLNRTKMLSEEVRNEFRKLYRGCKIEFTDIYARIESDDRELIKDKKRVYHLDPMTIFVY